MKKPTIQFDNELSAVASGQKTISLWGFPACTIADPEDPDHGEFLRLCENAAKMGLVVVQEDRQYGRHHYVDVFVTRPHLLHLVSMYSFLTSAFSNHSWCDGAEVARSRILGYSEESISRWLEFRRATGQNWGVSTIYLLMTAEHKREILKYAARILPLSPLDGMTSFHVLNSNLGIRSDLTEGADSLVIGRFCARHELIPMLYGDPPYDDPDFIAGTVECRQSESINKQITSEITFWSETGFRSCVE